MGIRLFFAVIKQVKGLKLHENACTTVSPSIPYDYYHKMRELLGLSKVSMVFIASTQGWRVSKTLLRVICSYISISNRFLYLEETRVLLFNIGARSWDKAFEYPRLRSIVECCCDQ